MTRLESERAVIRVLSDGEPMTVTEIMDATGCNRDAVLGIVYGRLVESAGIRQTARGMKPTVYRLAPQLPPSLLPQPCPLDRPVNPIVDGAVHSHLDTGRMIRRLMSQGEQDAAQALVKVWAKDDRELKQICERGER